MPEATDSAKTRADSLGVNLDEVEGSGSEGRITVADVEAAASSSPEADAPASEPPRDPVAVQLNPATGLGAYAFEDGFQIFDRQTKIVDADKYDVYKSEKISRGGVDQKVLVKA